MSLMIIDNKNRQLVSDLNASPEILTVSRVIPLPYRRGTWDDGTGKWSIQLRKDELPEGLRVGSLVSFADLGYDPETENNLHTFILVVISGAEPADEDLGEDYFKLRLRKTADIYEIGSRGKPSMGPLEKFLPPGAIKFWSQICGRLPEIFEAADKWIPLVRGGEKEGAKPPVVSFTK